MLAHPRSLNGLSVQEVRTSGGSTDIELCWMSEHESVLEKSVVCRLLHLTLFDQQVTLSSPASFVFLPCSLVTKVCSQ